MKKLLFFVTVIILGITGLLLLDKKNPVRSRIQDLTYSKPAAKIEPLKEQATATLKDGDIYNLAASFVKKTINGSEVKMLAYNGSIPGPLIKVTKGAQVTIRFTNNTDQDTTLHPHGVRVENAFDGVPGVTQKTVRPGETFAYTLKFPDEGIFWYHPHQREDYAQEMGLYGNFLVTPQDTGYWNRVNRELALFVDDIMMENGAIAPFQTVSTHTFMGRFGNTMLVNGQTDYAQDLNAGDVVRLYLTNAANTRIFNLSIPGAKIKRVGADNGRYEKEEYVDSIILAPAEREILEAYFEKPGRYELKHTTPQNTFTMATFNVADSPVQTSYKEAFTTLRTNHHFSADLEKYQQYLNTPADKTLTIGIQTNEMGGMNHNGNQHMMHDGAMMGNGDMNMMPRNKIEWEDTMGMMNAVSTSQTVKWKLIDAQTKKENDNIQWKFNKGDVVKIAIFNDPNTMHPMQHPIHIHGQRFLVLKTNGVSNKNLVWKDTALVQTGDTVELLVQMDNPGTWMIHCHIPEHLESGMMSTFKVI